MDGSVLERAVKFSFYFEEKLLASISQPLHHIPYPFCGQDGGSRGGGGLCH